MTSQSGALEAEVADLVRRARAKLGNDHAFRVRVLLDMVLIELEKMRTHRRGDGRD